MIIPPYLKSGDAVTLISPARFMDLQTLRPFQEWVEAQGWVLKLAPNLGAVAHQLGGSPSERLSDILWALHDSSLKAVFCARGGYGTMQLLSELRKMDFTQHPKWWVGFSDITALHITLQQQGIVSMHGPMAMQFDDIKKCSLASRVALANQLKGNGIQFSVVNEETEGFAHLAYWPVGLSAAFKAPLWGGNLSMIFAMLAAGAQPPNVPFVLFIEDLDEYVYHLDRMMQALSLSGIFEKAEAILVGSMCDMHDNAIPFGKNAKEIILNICELHNKPLIWGLPCGHESENITLKLGLDITFDAHYLIQN
mgnify:FL=1